MARKIYTAQDYLMITLNKLFDYLKQNEKSFVRIVVKFFDIATIVKIMIVMSGIVSIFVVLRIILS